MKGEGRGSYISALLQHGFILPGKPARDKEPGR
jgi:hypothetical protein